MKASPPVAFLSHASEDNALVDRLARDLLSAGIDVFNDDWEIRPGDSIVRKINEGLGRCTHFLAVLTPLALTKPWVQTEMDAGFIARIAKQAVFIPLRVGLTPAALPPLLQPMHSPSLDDYDRAVPDLVSFLHGADLKPALGPLPDVIRRSSNSSRLSPNAEAIARYMAENSQQGRELDPQVYADDVRQQFSMSDRDIADAAHELDQNGLIERHRSMGHGEIGFYVITPKLRLFLVMDPALGIGNPIDDARVIAAHLVASPEQELHPKSLADSLGWAPRRMNPALEYLLMRDFLLGSRGMGSGWVSPWFRAKPGLPAFLREGNR